MKYNNLIPNEIRTHFDIIEVKKDTEDSLVKGKIRCCDTNSFEVLVTGKVKYGIFSKMKLFPKNDIIVFELCCKKCGKIFSVFNTEYNGYDECKGICIENIKKPDLLVKCRKCQAMDFSVELQYEYPDIQELEQLKISDVSNAYTWVRGMIECNRCGTRYRNFLDCETG